MGYSFSFDKQFKSDIQNSRKWYNDQQKGLGKKFYEDVKAGLDAIKKSPQFAVRYDTIRCLPLSKYPFMIHYTTDESV